MEIRLSKSLILCAFLPPRGQGLLSWRETEKQTVTEKGEDGDEEEEKKEGGEVERQVLRQKKDK